MTLLEAVNKVLQKLREQPVNSLSESKYAQLIGSFVNDSVRTVSNSWNWLNLRQTVIVLTVADVWNYEFNTGGEPSLAKVKFRVQDVFAQGTGRVLRQANQAAMNRWFNLDNPSKGQPVYYSFNGLSNDNDPLVDLWPIPTGEEQLNFNIVITQDNLTSDGDIILVPADVVILGAYLRALGERGEDGSVAYERAVSEYDSALGTAISQEAELAPGETDFYAV